MGRVTEVARMTRSPVLLCLCVWCLLAFRPVLLAQETGSEKESQDAASSQPEPQRHIPVFGGANEFALATNLEYYEPEPGFNRQDRDIDIEVASAALAAHFRQGWEFQFDVLAMRARGTAILSSTPPIPAPVPSNAVAVGVGPAARWNIVQFSRWRLFVDAQGDLILNDRPFPPHGTSYDFLLRAGGGLSVRVSDRYWVESAFRFAHISNGQGFDAGNPSWQGRELSIGIRRTFRPCQESERNTTPSGEANDNNGHQEKAWITSTEYYWAAPGSNLQNPKTLEAMRALRVSHAWPFPKGFELQLGGMVAYPKNGNIFGFGPLLRWNFLRSGDIGLFADVGADLLQTGNESYIIPLGGTGYNFFLRGGTGASIRLHSAYWLDASFHYAHITSGFGPGGDSYIPWNGLGVSVALRHTFR
jgi:hypothetical protein